MMKTMKNLIWMAAIILTAATWSACSNEDEPTAAEQPAQSRTYTVTTTLSPRNGATTRSTMTDVGGATGITAEWEVGDQLWVSYLSGSDPKETTAEVIAVDPSTKAATITVTLTNPNDNGNITFGYPLSFYNHTKNLDTDQTGTLADINDNFAAIECSGLMTVSGSGVTLEGLSTMEPQMCIWKFSFKDGATDITSDITKLIIDLPENNQTYTVNPSSQSTIYVAMYGPVNAKPINIYAKTATGVYRKSAASVTLAVGTSYTTTGLALTSAAAANAAAGDVGKLIGADGNIYPTADIATTIGTTTRAMIAYVGSASDCTNGLAIALEDVSSSKYAWADAAGAVSTWASSKTVTGGTWRLPTAYDWQHMFIGCGSTATYVATLTNSNDGMAFNSDGFIDKLSTAGGTYCQWDYYHSSTEYTKTSDNDCVWLYAFSNGSFWWFLKTEKNHYVRAVLAF